MILKKLNTRLKILLSGGIALLVVVIFVANNIYTKAEYNADLDSRAEKNAVELIDKICQSQPSNNSKNAPNDSLRKFSKKEKVKDNNWKKDRIRMENDSIIIETDLNASPITYINKAKITPERLSKKISEKKYQEQLKDIAEKVASNIVESQATFVSSKELDNGYMEYRWNRNYCGYEFIDDFMIIVMNPEDGEVVSISKRFVSNIPTVNIVKNKNEAIDLAKKLLTNNKKIKLDKVVSAEKQIINPNKHWIDSNDVGEFNPHARLAYAITFQTTDGDEFTATVWIDCENGNVLGGQEIM